MLSVSDREGMLIFGFAFSSVSVTLHLILSFRVGFGECGVSSQHSGLETIENPKPVVSSSLPLS